MSRCCQSPSFSWKQNWGPTGILLCLSSAQRKIKGERDQHPLVFSLLSARPIQPWKSLLVCELIFLSFPRSCIWHEVNDLNPATVISFPHLSYEFEHGWYFHQIFLSVSRNVNLSKGRQLLGSFTLSLLVDLGPRMTGNRFPRCLGHPPKCHQGQRRERSWINSQTWEVFHSPFIAPLMCVAMVTSDYFWARRINPIEFSVLIT